jgi:hypothetical protein
MKKRLGIFVIVSVLFASCSAVDVDAVGAVADADADTGQNAGQDADNDSTAADKSTLNNVGLRAVLGLSVGNGNASVSQNRDKQGVSVRKSSGLGGVTLGVECIVPITPLVSVGFGGGVYVGPNKMKANAGTYYRNDSAELRKITADVNNFFNVIAANINFAAVRGGGGYGGIPLVDAGVFANFCRVMRYIGGANENVDPNFIGAAAAADGIYDIAAFPAAPNAAAVFANFLVLGGAANPLDAFGGMNMGALNRLREIVTTYYPNTHIFCVALPLSAAQI